MEKICIDYEEYERLVAVEEKYNKLRLLTDEQQTENEKEKERSKQAGNGPALTFGNPSEVIPPMDLISNADDDMDGEHEQHDQHDTSVVATTSQSTFPSIFKVEPHTFVHLRKGLKLRAEKLLHRIMNSSKKDIEVLQDGRVKLDQKIINGSNISDLLSVTYYPKRRAVGKDEWLKKLHDLNLLAKPKNATCAATVTKPQIFPGQGWWYIGPL